MRGVLALLLVVGGGVLAYAVATGKFPAAPASASSSAQTPTQLGNAAGNAVLLATGNGPSGASTAGQGLVSASSGSTSSSSSSGGVGPILIGGKQVF